METKSELQIKVKGLLESSPKESIAVSKRIWEEFKDEDAFNLYDALQVLKAAKNDSSIEFDFVYEVAKKYSDKDEVINRFKWFAFNKYLKGKKNIELLPNEVNINKMLMITSQANLREDNSYPCPYTIAIMELSKGHSKNMFNGRKIYEYLEKLNPLYLSTNNNNYILEGEEIKVASDLENYYALKTKSLLKIEMYEECKSTCEIALNKLSEFHYNNDLWFKMRIAICYEKLGDLLKSEELFQKLVSSKAGNDKWFLYHDISELYYQQNNLEKALEYAINATFYGTDLDKMNGLLLLQARILVKLNRIEEGKKIAELILSIIKKYELRNKQDYHNLFKYFSIDSENPIEFNSIYKIAKEFWLKERYKNKYELSGKIIFIHPNGKLGKIKTLDNRIFDFHRRDFFEKQRSIIDLKDAKVSFFEMSSYDEKTIAENIKILEKIVVPQESLAIGTLLSGTIKNFADFGIFVKLNGFRDGLVHKNILPIDIKNSFSAVYHIGQKINVRVEKISNKGIELKIIS
ncbi:polynucleotide phosphorylase/polyadenylase [compost metagenome]